LIRHKSSSGFAGLALVDSGMFSSLYAGTMIVQGDGKIQN